MCEAGLLQASLKSVRFSRGPGLFMIFRDRILDNIFSTLYNYSSYVKTFPIPQNEKEENGVFLTHI